MNKDPVEIDELEHDVKSFTPKPDENHDYDREYDHDQRDTDNIVNELTKIIDRAKSDKCESLFDCVKEPPKEPARDESHYLENPNKFYNPKGRLWND